MNKNKFVTIRLPEDVYLKIKEEAAKNTRTILGQILHYLRQALNK
jgi:hypothetical protein